MLYVEHHFIYCISNFEQENNKGGRNKRETDFTRSPMSWTSQPNAKNRLTKQEHKKNVSYASQSDTTLVMWWP